MVDPEIENETVQKSRKKNTVLVFYLESGLHAWVPPKDIKPFRCSQFDEFCNKNTKNKVYTEALRLCLEKESELGLKPPEGYIPEDLIDESDAKTPKKDTPKKKKGVSTPVKASKLPKSPKTPKKSTPSKIRGSSDETGKEERSQTGKRQRSSAQSPSTKKIRVSLTSSSVHSQCLVRLPATKELVDLLCGELVKYMGAGNFEVILTLLNILSNIQVDIKILTTTKLGRRIKRLSSKEKYPEEVRIVANNLYKEYSNIVNEENIKRKQSEPTKIIISSNVSESSTTVDSSSEVNTDQVAETTDTAAPLENHNDTGDKDELLEDNQEMVDALNEKDPQEQKDADVEMKDGDE